LRRAGETVIYERVLQDMKARDERDSARRTAPLRPADDAIVLDTTDLDPEATFQAALAVIEKKLAGKHRRDAR